MATSGRTSKSTTTTSTRTGSSGQGSTPAAESAKKTDADSDVVTIEATLTKDEYESLLSGAATASMTPNDFLRQAIRDKTFYQREAPPGSRILIEAAGKLRTVR
jgi:hypothetical protein